ncbi:MAG: type II secretion system major pseudopilin GspG [Bradyrhizobium sp.]|nr:type II secretion system major pseudopilin GspG [Bradyrhizobium sp.]
MKSRTSKIVRGIGRKARRGNPRDRQGGFTLVEMLVVITIIGLIMALVGPRVLNYLSDSRVKGAKIQIQSFSAALDLFYLDAGRYPTGAEGLEALVRPVTGIAAWNGPYVKGGKIPADPWGNAYVYRVPGERSAYEIRSLGSDGQEGGSGVAADIASDQN